MAISKFSHSLYHAKQCKEPMFQTASLYYLWFRRTLNLLPSPPLASPPLPSGPLPYIFAFWDPPWQIFTLHPIILKFCMPLLLYEGPQTTKFQPSTPSGTCIFKVSKTPKFAMVYSSTGSFTRLCVEVLIACALSFVF